VFISRVFSEFFECECIAELVAIFHGRVQFGDA